ncbi:hypothetical protein PMAYCL1PPCAC_28302, partial [Pristionchus mayeri]
PAVCPLKPPENRAKMGLESMMKMLMMQRNEKKEKAKIKTPCVSKDPNRVFLKEMAINFFLSDPTEIRYDEKEMIKLLDQV